MWSSEVGCWCDRFSADTFESLQVEDSGRADFQNIETIGLALGRVCFASLRMPSTFHTFMQILQKQIHTNLVCVCDSYGGSLGPEGPSLWLPKMQQEQTVYIDTT